MSIPTQLRTTLAAALAGLTAGALVLLPGAATAAPANLAGPASLAPQVRATGTLPSSYVALVSRGTRTRFGVDPERQSLELVSPTGARTVLFSSTITRKGSGYLTLSDVSADGRTALVTTSTGRRLTTTRSFAVDTATGAVRALDVGRGDTVLQLAPDGNGLLLGQYRGRQLLLASIGWDGVVRPTSAAVGGRVLTLDPTTVLVPTPGRAARSLDAVSLTSGAITRRYPTGGRSCAPVRRWDASQVLLSCYGGRTAQVLRLLDPATGNLVALTEQHPKGPRSSGDVDARLVGGVLYPQSTTPCGYAGIGRLLPDGRVSAVRVPGTTGHATLLGAGTSALVVQTGGACRGDAPRQTLSLLDPATGTAQPVVVLPGKEIFDRVLPLGEQQASIS